MRAPVNLFSVRPVLQPGRIAFAAVLASWLLCAAEAPLGLTITLSGERSAVRLDFLGNPGHAYDILCKDSLSDLTWFNLTNVVAPSSGSIILEQETQSASRFYSVRRQVLTECYVDSNLGSDHNPGTSALPLRSLSEALARHKTNGVDQVMFWLKRGSVFRESFGLPDNCHVQAYGDGERPVISGADVLELGGFRPVPGFSNTFALFVSPNVDRNPYTGLSHSNVLMVWEDDRRLIGGGAKRGDWQNNVSGIPAVETLEGSWWYDSQERTLYVHPSGGTHPYHNGRRYEISTRTLAVHGGNNTVVEDLIAEKAYALTGTGSQGYAIFGWGTNTYLRCEGRQAYDHAIGVANNRAGDYLFDACVARDCATDLAPPATLFVVYKSAPVVNSVAHFTNCWAVQPFFQTTNLVYGFYAHDDQPNGTPARVRSYYSDCGAQNTALGWRCTTGNDAMTYNSSSWVGVSNLHGLVIPRQHPPLQLAKARLVASSVEFQNKRTNIVADSNLIDAFLWAEGGLVVSNSTFFAHRQILAALRLDGGGVAWSWQNWFGGAWQFAYVGSGKTNLLGSDRNIYDVSSLAKDSPLKTVRSLAEWQTLLPHLDSNSLAATPPWLPWQTNYLVNGLVHR